MTSQYVMSEHEALEFGRIILQHFYGDKKLIFNFKRIALTKLFFVCWFVSFDWFDGEKMAM